MNSSGSQTAAGFAAAAILLQLISRPVQGGVLLAEPFAYADGPLIAVAEGRWLTQSGTSGQIPVSGGGVVLTQKASEDVRAALAGGPFPARGTTALYLACTVRFTELPSGAGTYFAHFKDGGTGFRGRLFASVQGAAPGMYRMGVSEASNTPTLLTQDLEVETAYTVVCRYDVGTAATTLWINPAAESEPGVTAADDGTALAIHDLALRQSLSSGNGMGTLVLDDLRVATTFAELFDVAVSAPRIVQHPRDKLAASGETVTFQVTATGEPPLRYQWLRDGVLLPDATAAELTLTEVSVAAAGLYEVVVSNALGSVASDVATLTVRGAPESEVGVIACLADAGGGLTLRWPGCPGCRYVVLGASTPDGPWVVLSDRLEVPEYAEPIPEGPAARYYRVQAFY